MTRIMTAGSEDQAFRDLMIEANGGTGRFTLVTGTVASGKTRLLSKLSAHARSNGAQVLRASCTRFSRSDPLSVPRQLLGADAGQTREPVAEILRLSDRRIVVVCVDDLRYADAESTRFLHELAVESADHPVLVVATDRRRTPCSTFPADHLYQALDMHRIVLKPLSGPEIAELAERDFNLRVSADFASAIRALTSGNPMLTRAALLDHSAQAGRYDSGLAGTVSAEFRVGPAYRQSVLDTLYRVDCEVREIAEMIAVVGGFGTAGIIADLTDTDTAVVERCRRELVSAGLLRPNGFRHPAAQEAVLLDMSRARRTAMCRLAAVALGTSGAPAEDVARWLSAVEEVDAQVIHQAPGRPSLDSVNLSPADQLWRPGDHVETLWQATNLMSRLDSDASSLRLADGPRAAELKASQLLIGCEFPGLLLQGLGEQIIDSPPAAAMTRSARFGAAWSLTRLLTGGVTAWDITTIATTALENLELRPHTVTAVLAGLTTLTCGGDLGLAGSACDRFLGLATDQSATTWRAQLLGLRAEIRVQSGDNTGAVADAEAALDLLPRWCWGARLGGLLSTLLLAHTTAGDLPAASAHLRHPLPEATFDTRHGLDYLYARGHHHLASGLHLLALADFLRCGRAVVNWGIDRDEQIPWRLGVAATYVAMGDYGSAVARIDELVSRLGENGSTRAREAIFEMLRESVGAPDLQVALTRLGGDPPAHRRPVSRYKISDRFSSYLDKLSPSEQRVALLAAKGATNQRIAHDLSITVSTVEQHLTRTYRKLHLAGRSELRAKLG